MPKMKRTTFASRASAVAERQPFCVSFSFHRQRNNNNLDLFKAIVV